MKRLFLAALLLFTGCTTSIRPTPQPVTPTVTASAVPTVTATLAPTDEPPYKLAHPAPIALGTIHVLNAVCEARATTWAFYSWGMVKNYNADSDAACRERGTL